jgi:HlyD family secretion protein
METVMDVQRPPEVARQRRRRRVLWGAGLIIAVIGTTVALARLEPAAPSVDSAPLWMDEVKRGTMLRQVRGPGVLVPDDTRWIPAVTDGRVERILVQPGTTVATDTIILELSNPQLEQEALAAELAFNAASAQWQSVKANLERDLLQLRAQAAGTEADLARARMDVEVNEALAAKGLIDQLTVRRARLQADTVATQQRLDQERLTSIQDSMVASLAVQQAEVDQRRSVATLRRNQVRALDVRAGVAGVLQQVPVEVGQQVNPGLNLARVADPSRLKAEVRIAETQVKDVAVGQSAEIDTRTGIVRGHVARIDPASLNGTVTVDVVLAEALPRGARPDMNVEGTIELERLEDILYVGRPAFGQEESAATLFKVDADGGGATRTRVELGRSSVTTIEVASGLAAGDRVVLSDMSAWDDYDRVRFR